MIAACSIDPTGKTNEVTGRKTFLAAGEAMIEMSGGSEDGRFRMGFAGDTMNTAWYARQLLDQGWTVGYVTKLGSDRYSQAMRSFFEESGIDTAHVGIVPDRQPGVYFIHQEDGDRHFTYWRENSAAKLLAADGDALQAAFDTADTIYFSGITLAILNVEHRATLIDALGRARQRGATVAFDPNIRLKLWPGPDAIRAAIVAAASVSDLAFPTFGDDQALFGDGTIEKTAARYIDLGASEVIVKNGPNLAIARTAQGTFEVAPSSDATVVDATGAGDSFNAGYIAARATGSSVPAAVEHAHRIASICIAHHGALAPVDAVHRVRSS